MGGAEWNSPAYDPQTNLILVGEVDWCDTVTPRTVDELRSVKVGQPWAGMATWNPFWMFGRMGGTDGHWAGWVYAVDADTGVWKWRLKSNYPIVSGMTPTAGGVVFFGDIGGNFYALDAANGQKLWGQDLGGAIGGGVITYTRERCAKGRCGGRLYAPRLADEDREGQDRRARPRQRLREPVRSLVVEHDAVFLSPLQFAKTRGRIRFFRQTCNVGRASEADRRLLSRCVAAACLRCSP